MQLERVRQEYQEREFRLRKLLMRSENEVDKQRERNGEILSLLYENGQRLEAMLRRLCEGRKIRLVAPAEILEQATDEICEPEEAAPLEELEGAAPPPSDDVQSTDDELPQSRNPLPVLKSSISINRDSNLQENSDAAPAPLPKRSESEDEDDEDEGPISLAESLSRNPNYGPTCILRDDSPVFEASQEAEEEPLSLTLSQALQDSQVKVPVLPLTTSSEYQYFHDEQQVAQQRRMMSGECYEDYSDEDTGPVSLATAVARDPTASNTCLITAEDQAMDIVVDAAAEAEDSPQSLSPIPIAGSSQESSDEDDEATPTLSQAVASNAAYAVTCEIRPESPAALEAPPAAEATTVTQTTTTQTVSSEAPPIRPSVTMTELPTIDAPMAAPLAHKKISLFSDMHRDFLFSSVHIHQNIPLQCPEQSLHEVMRPLSPEVVTPQYEPVAPRELVQRELSTFDAFTHESVLTTSILDDATGSVDVDVPYDINANTDSDLEEITGVVLVASDDEGASEPRSVTKPSIKPVELRPRDSSHLMSAGLYNSVLTMESESIPAGDLPAV